MKRHLERVTKEDIKAYLTEIGAEYFMPVQTGYGARTVDILGCLRGHFFAIEVKRDLDKKGLTGPQLRELRRWERAGAIVLAVDDVDQVKKVLR